MSEPPRWFRPVAVVALIWNLLGCAAYISDVTLTADDIARLTEAERALYASRPAWAVAGTALAVWFGAAGSLGLVLRRRWALPVLIVSLAGVVIQDLGLFVVTDAASLAGPVAVVLQGVVLLVAIALVWLARHASAQGWLR